MPCSYIAAPLLGALLLTAAQLGTCHRSSHLLSERAQVCYVARPLGCFSINSLSGTPITSNTNSLGSCSSTCADHVYFGLEYGYGCICGDAIASSGGPIDSSACSSPCPGNDAQNCGGPAGLSLYSYVKDSAPSSTLPVSSTVSPSSTETILTTTSSAVTPTMSESTTTSISETSTSESSNSEPSTTDSSTSASSTLEPSTTDSSITETSTSTSSTIEPSTTDSSITETSTSTSSTIDSSTSTSSAADSSTTDSSTSVLSTTDSSTTDSSTTDSSTTETSTSASDTTAASENSSTSFDSSSTSSDSSTTSILDTTTTTSDSASISTTDDSSTTSTSDASSTTFNPPSTSTDTVPTTTTTLPPSSTSTGLVCATPSTACSGTCVNLQTDKNNCGTCGQQCGSGTCVAGSCLCPSQTTTYGTSSSTTTAMKAKRTRWIGEEARVERFAKRGIDVRAASALEYQTCYGIQCVDTYSDVNNCGACGTICDPDGTAAPLCHMGECSGCSHQRRAPARMVKRLCPDSIPYCGLDKVFLPIRKYTGWSIVPMKDLIPMDVLEGRVREAQDSTDFTFVNGTVVEEQT